MTAFLEIEGSYISAAHIIRIHHLDLRNGAVLVQWKESVDGVLSQGGDVTMKGAGQTFELGINPLEKDGRSVFPRSDAMGDESKKAARELLALIGSLQVDSSEKRTRIIKFEGSTDGEPRPKYWSVEVLADPNARN